MFLNIKEIDAPELASWLDQKPGQFRILDVRQMNEMTAGTIPGAEALPMHTLPLRLNELGNDETLVLACRSGARSAQACAFLQQQGYENVFNLKGGLMGWANNGQPITLPEAV